MLSRRTLWFNRVVLLVVPVLVGCSDSYGGRMAVAGAVKLKGQPLKEGSITLIPLDGQDTQSGAAIVNGAYNIPRQSGLKPGHYLVQITAGDGKTIALEEAAAPGGSNNIVSMDLIPEDWNTKSKKQVEVKMNAANQFDFDIPNVNTPKKKR